MTVASECPTCGREHPAETSEQYVTDSGNITYHCEDLYCVCGTQVGGFAHPDVDLSQHY